MEKSSNTRIVMVTAPDMKVARKLARAGLKARLIACANLIPSLESHYWWKGNIESGTEVLLLLKTTARNLGALEKLILRLHPYDTAEFVALRPDSITEKYLNWWEHSARRTVCLVPNPAKR